MYVCCGDALFDLFADEEADLAAVALKGRVGGSPLNVSLGLARLGHPTGFFTKISSDVFGRRIRTFMEREGIDTRFLVPTHRHTTLAIVSLDANRSPAYDFYIKGTADRSIETGDVPATLSPAVRGLHFASYSTVTEPTASALLHLARQEAGRRFISYDPNIRASIEPDLDIWREKVRDFVPLAAMVKASEEDLELLYPKRSIEAVLSDWVGLGAAVAIVTRGEKGAVCLSRSGAGARVPGLPIAVADTVGAGDTFQAALLAWTIENDWLSREALGSADRTQLEALIGFAVRAAAVTCSRRGADLPRRADLGLPPLR